MYELNCFSVTVVYLCFIETNLLLVTNSLTQNIKHAAKKNSWQRMTICVKTGLMIWSKLKVEHADDQPILDKITSVKALSHKMITNPNSTLTQKSLSLHHIIKMPTWSKSFLRISLIT